MAFRGWDKEPVALADGTSARASCPVIISASRSTDIPAFFSKWFSNTPMIVDLAYGEAEGNKFRFYAPGIIYNKVDDGDRDGIQLAQTSFDLTGSMEPGDDELAILLL